jgi:nucleotide-binding universal stress UspA family protein
MGTAHIRLDRILVPTDLSELGDQAVAYASALAPPGASLDLLHVVETEPTPNPLYAHYGFGARPGASQREALERDLEHALRQRVIDLAAAHRVSTLFHVVRDGSPAERICEYAEHLDVGAVFMTTHGCSGLTHLIGGSVAQEVARRIRRPLILLRPGRS